MISGRFKEKLSSDNLLFYFISATFLLLPTGTAPPLIAISIAGLIWIFSGKILEVKKIIVKPWFFPVILMFILPWIGLIFSKDRGLGLDYALKSKYWLVLFLTASLKLDGKRILTLIKLFLAGLLAGACLAMIQQLGLMEPIRHGFPGFGVVHTLVSMYLIVGIMIASYFFPKVSTKSKKVGIMVIILLLIYHIAALYGRSGYLILIILSPMIVNNLTSNLSIPKKLIVLLTFLLFFVSFPNVRDRTLMTVDAVKKQYRSITQGTEKDEVHRFYIYRDSFELFLKHPWFGIGTGSIKYYTAEKMIMISHAHNNFLYMGVSFGILGIIACAWLFGVMFFVSWRARKRPLGFFVFSIAIVAFLSGMFDTQLLNTGTLLLMSMGYGFINQLYETT